MIKLIKLEWKKGNVKKYIRNAIIMTAILLSLILLVAGESELEEPAGLYGMSIIAYEVEVFTHMCYMIFTGVMLSGFLVSAYENKTISLMFSYPIKRQKILLSKVFAVWIFNVLALIISKLLIYGILLLTAGYTHISTSSIPIRAASFWLNIVLGSIAMISISYVALLVGMKMKSSKATIVTSVIVVLLTQGNIGDFTLSNSIPFYAILLVLSVISVYLMLYNAETKDLI